MASEHLDDMLAEKFIADLRHIEGDRRVDPGFTTRLEHALRSHDGISMRSWVLPRFRFRMQWVGTFQFISVLAVVALLGSLAYGLRDTWAPGSADHVDLGAVVPAADAGTATPVDQAAWPSAEQIMAGCPVQRRTEGSVEALLAATTWQVPTDLPVAAEGYPTFVESSALGFDKLSASTITQLDAVLASLFPCTVQDLAADLISPQFDGTKLDGFYLANFSDNFMRRAFLQSDYNPREPYLGRFMTRRPPVVTVGWDVSDIDVPRVQAFVAANNPPTPEDGWLVNFVQVQGHWQIDEYTDAVLDKAAIPTGWPTSGTSVADIPLFDAGQNTYAQGSVVSSFGLGGPTWSGSGMVLRIYNFGTLPRRLVIDDLGVNVAILPGEVVTSYIDGPPGSHQVSISLNASKSDGPASSFNIQILAPGEVWQGLG